jgi:hypothetical protein
LWRPIDTIEATRIEWLTKEQAGEILGIKPRSVLAMIDRNRLRSKFHVASETNQRTKLVHAGDIERERHRRENGEGEANGQESAGISAKTPACQPEGE